MEAEMRQYCYFKHIKICRSKEDNSTLMSSNLLQNLAPFGILIVVWLLLRWRERRKRKSLSAHKNVVFENILPRSAYDVDETGYWKRLPVALVLYFGISFTVADAVFGILHLSSQNLISSPSITKVLAITVASLLFGILLTVSAKRTVRVSTDALYAGENWIISPPPENQLFYYQLLCTQMKDRKRIGGVLYIGRSGLLFSPHKRNRKKNFPLEMSPIESVEVAVKESSSVNVIQWLLAPHPQAYLEIRWRTGSACFMTPCVRTAMEKITRLMETLKQVPK